MHEPMLLLATLLSSTGNYFASHFFMGGEKFDTPHPEGYLFGENMDLNFLGNRPVQVKTSPHVPSWLHVLSRFNPASPSCSSHTWHLRLTSPWRLWGVWSTLEKTLCGWSGKNSSQFHNSRLFLRWGVISTDRGQTPPTAGIKMTLTRPWRMAGNQRSSTAWSSPLTLTLAWPSPSIVKHSRSFPTAWQCKTSSNPLTCTLHSPFTEISLCRKPWNGFWGCRDAECKDRNSLVGSLETSSNYGYGFLE